MTNQLITYRLLIDYSLMSSISYVWYKSWSGGSNGHGAVTGDDRLLGDSDGIAMNSNCDCTKVKTSPYLFRSC